MSTWYVRMLNPKRTPIDRRYAPLPLDFHPKICIGGGHAGVPVGAEPRGRLAGLPARAPAVWQDLKRVGRGFVMGVDIMGVVAGGRKCVWDLGSPLNRRDVMGVCDTGKAGHGEGRAYVV